MFSELSFYVISKVGLVSSLQIGSLQASLEKPQRVNAHITNKSLGRSNAWANFYFGQVN
jgi:hypothetical protein